MSGHNNPVKLAVQECQRVTGLNPDIVVSIGTGSAEDSTSPLAASFRHVVMDGFIPRLWRAYMSSFDGERIFWDFVNGLDPQSRGRYRRHNVLSKDLPSMDNISHLEEMGQLVLSNPSSMADCRATLLGPLASSFYFELAGMPGERGSHFSCIGFIRCRIPGPTVPLLLERVFPLPLELSFVMEKQFNEAYREVQDFCTSCLQFRKLVRFVVRDLEQQVAMGMHDSTKTASQIERISEQDSDLC